MCLKIIFPRNWNEFSSKMSLSAFMWLCWNRRSILIFSRNDWDCCCGGRVKSGFNINNHLLHRHLKTSSIIIIIIIIIVNNCYYCYCYYYFCYYYYHYYCCCCCCCCCCCYLSSDHPVQVYLKVAQLILLQSVMVCYYKVRRLFKYKLR